MLSRYLVVLVACTAAVPIVLRRLYILYRLVRSGPASGSSKSGPRDRSRTLFTEVLGQRKLLKWPAPGVAHAVIFWSFIILFLTIIEACGDLFSPTFAIPGIGHFGAVGFMEDLCAVGVLASVGVFFLLRFRQGPQRLGRGSRFAGSHTGAAYLVLWMIVAVIVSLLVYRGAEADTGAFPYDDWAFASHAVGALVHPLGPAVNRRLATAFLDINVIVILAFFVLVVYSKHLHILVAPFNVGTARLPRPLGALATTPDLDPANLTEDARFGAGTVMDLNRKQRLDLLSCTECGRCQSACPAWATGKALSPKLLVMHLRDELLAPPGGQTAGTRVLVPRVITEDVLWSCTTCGACVEECPVDIGHVDTIVDMRRHQVLAESRFPREATNMLRGIEKRGDPWGIGPAKRLDWTDSLGFTVAVADGPLDSSVEYLYFVGCAGAFDERARKTTQAVVRLLRQAGVRFAVLGKRETCTGDPARRVGNEYLYQEQAKTNINTFRAAGVQKVITSCPHCFNTIANEYPGLGGKFEVVHHSQLLAQLVEEGRVIPGQFDALVTYHDPCYLGRHNRVFDQPRSVIGSVPGVQMVEMPRCRERGFCCGAGGGHMWLEERGGTRVNNERTAEALSTGASVIATACPYCLVMLDDAVRAQGPSQAVKVLDIAQVLEMSFSDGGTPEA